MFSADLAQANASTLTTFKNERQDSLFDYATNESGKEEPVDDGHSNGIDYMKAANVSDLVQ